jgi:hypothetical protein
LSRSVRVEDEAVERARRDVRDARSAAQLRAAQAVLMPVDLGLSLKQTAKVLGRNTTWVSRTRNEYINGKAVFSDTRGGRQHSLLSPQSEIEAVKDAVMKAGRPGQRKTVRQVLRQVLKARLGTDPSEGALTSILLRVASKVLVGGTPAELERWSAQISAFFRRAR